MILYNKKKKLDIGGVLNNLGAQVGEDAAQNATLTKASQFSDPLGSLSQTMGASYWNKQGNRYGLDAVNVNPTDDKIASAITQGSALTPFSAEGEGIGEIIKGLGTQKEGAGILQPYGIKYKTYNSGQRAGDVAGGIAETGTSAALTAFGVPSPVANAIGRTAGKIIQAPASIIGDNVNLSKKNLSDFGNDALAGHFGQAFQALGQGSSNQNRQTEQRRVMRDVTGIQQNQALQTGFQQYSTLLPKYDKNVMTRYASRGGRIYSPLYNHGGLLIKPTVAKFDFGGNVGDDEKRRVGRTETDMTKLKLPVGSSVRLGGFKRSSYDEGGVLDPRQRTNTLSGMGQFMAKGGRLHDDVVTYLRSAITNHLKGGGTVEGAPYNNSGKVMTEQGPGYSSEYAGLHDALKSVLRITNGYPALKEGGGITNGGTYKKGGGGFPKFGSMQSARSPLFYYHGGAIILGGQLHAEENKKTGAGNPIYAGGKKVAETEREELLLNKEQTDKLEHHIAEYDRTGQEDHLHKIGHLMQHIIKNETVDSSGKVLKKMNGGEIRFPTKRTKNFYSFSDGR